MNKKDSLAYNLYDQECGRFEYDQDNDTFVCDDEHYFSWRKKNGHVFPCCSENRPRTREYVKKFGILNFKPSVMEEMYELKEMITYYEFSILEFRKRNHVNFISEKIEKDFQELDVIRKRVLDALEVCDGEWDTVFGNTIRVISSNYAHHEYSCGDIGAVLEMTKSHLYPILIKCVEHIFEMRTRNKEKTFDKSSF